MRKTILVIDDSSLVRDFLTKQLENYGFNVIPAINGLDGFGKMRSEIPDLVIMDYFLKRKSANEILESKLESPTIKDVPIIVISTTLERDVVVQLAKQGVGRVLFKPIKIDKLLSAVSEVLDYQIEVDNTPCLLDAHLNDKILFVEIAQGFNREKLSLLKYKVAELLKLYDVEIPRILLLMSDIQFRSEDKTKLEGLIEDLLEFTQSARAIKILTSSQEVREFINTNRSLDGVGAVKTLEEAMDGLLGVKGLEMLTGEQDNVQKQVFSSNQNLEKEAFQLNFASESEEFLKRRLFEDNKKVAIVDDDFVVHSIIESAFEKTNWEISTFSDGAEFVDAIKEQDFDLVFLDIIMPGLNGFGVLQFLSTFSKEIPVIILTALSRQESVKKAMSFNIKSYLIKPIKPDGLIKKAIEVLNTDF